MEIENLIYFENQWQCKDKHIEAKDVDIVFIFGDREAIKLSKSYQDMCLLYPYADIVGCSSSGNIQGDMISRATMVASAVSFEKSYIQIAVKDLHALDNEVAFTKTLVEQLLTPDLQHVFILSPGLHINGSSLAQGANEVLDYKIPVTGGLAGDGDLFEETWVIANDEAKQNRVVAVGFYGESVSVSSGCFAGWKEFGVLRTITKSEKNIVYEIDHQPALELYKKYLGEYAKDLPSSGLRFPINIRQYVEDRAIVRSVLAIDEAAQSLIFAGDVPEGSLTRLMKIDIDALIDGAETAARLTAPIPKTQALGLVVSCVGRRAVLDQLIDEELEAVEGVLGKNVSLIGFYSYGELAPFKGENNSCQLHNQTLTLTVISEQ